MYLTDPGLNTPDEQGGYERFPNPDLIPPGNFFFASL